MRSSPQPMMWQVRGRSFLMSGAWRAEEGPEQPRQVSGPAPRAAGAAAGRLRASRRIHRGSKWGAPAPLLRTKSGRMGRPWWVGSCGGGGATAAGQQGDGPERGRRSTINSSPGPFAAQQSGAPGTAGAPHGAGSAAVTCVGLGPRRRRLRQAHQHGRHLSLQHSTASQLHGRAAWLVIAGGGSGSGVTKPRLRGRRRGAALLGLLLLLRCRRRLLRLLAGRRLLAWL